MYKVKKAFLITLSAMFAAILCLSLLFGIRPTLAADVTILATDGTSVYITGEGVTYDKEKNTYSVTNNTQAKITVVNEYRIFESLNIKYGNVNALTSNTPVTTFTPTGDFSITVNTSKPEDEDHGSYFSSPFIINSDSQLIALEKILAGRAVNDDYKSFDFPVEIIVDAKDPTTATDDVYGPNANFDPDEAKLKLQYGYFLLSDNILLDTNEFYGIGTQATPFRGCFDFGGYHITLNILNTYERNNLPNTIYSGLFGYLDGDGTKESILKNVDISGKIAFDGTNSNTHYVGGIAGLVTNNTVLANALSEVSISVENNATNYVGGMFGSLRAPLEDEYNYIYKSVYGVIQATTEGSNKDLFVGALAGEIRDTYVYSFNDDSIAADLVANNLGSINAYGNSNHNSGNVAIGGVAGIVSANNRNVTLKNVNIKINEEKNIVGLNDGNDVLNDYVAVGGAYGVFANSDRTITTDLPYINVETGSLKISASTNAKDSKGVLYSSGFVGNVAKNSHVLDLSMSANRTLIKGNASISSVHNGQGDLFAGGLFGYGALLVPASSSDSIHTNKILLNDASDDSSLTILAQQSLTSTKDGSNQRDVATGGFSGFLPSNYSINNFELTINNATITSQRLVGSTSIGNLLAGGFSGHATSDRSTGRITNVTVNLNNTSVNSLSLSYVSNAGSSFGNMSSASGFIAYVFGYGRPGSNNSNASVSKTSVTINANAVVGLENITVNCDNFGKNAPEFTVHSIQNSASGNDNYASEGYAAGLFGLFDSSFARNITFDAKGEQALIYFYSTNSPNTASSGGLIAHSRNDNGQYGVDGGKVNNVDVVCKAYSEKQSGGVEYDLYAGGGMGILATASTGSTTFARKIIVTNSTVQAIGENKMAAYAGGILGGIWWQTTNLLLDSAFIDGNVYATSIDANSYAGGICGHINKGALYNNSVINTYVKATSESGAAGAAGILGFRYSGEYINNNYSQAYVSAQGGTAQKTGKAAISVGVGDHSESNIKGNFFDLASFDNSTLNSDLDNNMNIPMFVKLTHPNNQMINITGSNPVNNDTLNNNNYYIVLNETRTRNNGSYRYNRASSLHLTTGQSADLYSYIFRRNSTDYTLGIVNNNNVSNYNRFYLQFKGDTSAATINKTSNSTSKTTITARNQNGLIISVVWFNIYGETSVSNEADLTAEKGWYPFCSYAIKINDGRPVNAEDKMNISLYDDDTNKPLKTYRDHNGIHPLDGDSNVAGYYYLASENAYYALVNVDQSGFSNTDYSHIAQSIRVNAMLTNDNDANYKNFPKYSFYDIKSDSITSSQPDLNKTKWYVSDNSSFNGYDYNQRIKAILGASGNKAFSSAFNGRLSVDRDTDNYNLVITPDSYLEERTIIVIEFENNMAGANPYKVILEFVPNYTNGLRVIPGDDTPALDTIIDKDTNGNDVYTYVYVNGDTVRFDAYESRRYDKTSFLAAVNYSSDQKFVNKNGTVNIPVDNPPEKVRVDCNLVSGAANTTVYIKVLEELSFNFNTIGTNYNSDRKVVSTTPFNFTFKASPGYGLAPEKVQIDIGTYSIDLASGGMFYSTTESNTTYKDDIKISFNHLTKEYEVIILGDLVKDDIYVTIEFSIVYSVVFDTGIPNISVSERYIVYELKQGSSLDNKFFNEVKPAVIDAIKNKRYGFTFNDYYLTDEASSIPRYGDTFITMCNPLYDEASGDYYNDINRNNVYDAGDEIHKWRSVTGPYTFYARWTYDIALEVPNGVTVYSPLVNDKVVPLIFDERPEIVDPDIANGKLALVPINTNEGFPFVVKADSTFEGTPRFKIYQVSQIYYIDANNNGTYEKASDIVGYNGEVLSKYHDNGSLLYYYYLDGSNEVKLVYTYDYVDLTDYVEPYLGLDNTYILPQYDALGHSLINGVIFLKVFSDSIDFEVSDIGEEGIVSVNNDIYENGIFTTVYSINYSSVTIDGVTYSNGIPVSYSVSNNGLQFKFTDSAGNDMLLPEGTSLRVYRHVNNVPYDAGEMILTSPSSTFNVNDFTNLATSNKLKIDDSILLKSETYNLVVTLPKDYIGYEDLTDAKVSVITTHIETCKQFAYTLTLDTLGNIVQPKAYDVLMNETRPESYYERPSDLFNVHSFTPARGEVRVNNNQTITLRFYNATTSDGIYDYRHGDKYYIWEIKKNEDGSEFSIPLLEQYLISETQQYKYYLARQSDVAEIVLSNYDRNVTIKLLEVDNLQNPATGIVLYSFSFY